MICLSSQEQDKVLEEKQHKVYKKTFSTFAALLIRGFTWREQNRYIEQIRLSRLKKGKNDFC